MDLEDAGCRARFLIRDRDGKFPGLFDAILADAGIDVVLSGVRMPRMNSIMERWVQTCQRELLDRTLIWDQSHLLRALRDFEQFYNGHRPHQGIANARPLQPLPVPLVTPDQGFRQGQRSMSSTTMTPPSRSAVTVRCSLKIFSPGASAKIRSNSPSRPTASAPSPTRSEPTAASAPKAPSAAPHHRAQPRRPPRPGALRGRGPARQARRRRRCRSPGPGHRRGPPRPGRPAICPLRPRRRAGTRLWRLSRTRPERFREAPGPRSPGHTGKYARCLLDGDPSATGRCRVPGSRPAATGRKENSPGPAALPSDPSRKAGGSTEVRREGAVTRPCRTPRRHCLTRAFSAHRFPTSPCPRGCFPTESPRTKRHSPAHGGTGGNVALLALTSLYAGSAGLAILKLPAVRASTDLLKSGSSWWIVADAHEDH